MNKRKTSMNSNGLEDGEGPSKRLKATPKRVTKILSQNGEAIGDALSYGSSVYGISDDSSEAASETPDSASSTPKNPVPHNSSNGVKTNEVSETSTTKKKSSNTSDQESFSDFLGKFNFTFNGEDEFDVMSLSRMSTTSSMNKNMHDKPENSTINGTLGNTQERSMPSLSLEDEASEDIKVLNIPYRNLEIVSMPYPASVTLHGYLRVKVLMGSVSIHGSNLYLGDKAEVFSTESNMLLKALTLKSPTLMSSKGLRRELKSLKPPKAELEEFLQHIGAGSAVLIVERIPLPPALRFLEYYCPDAVETQRNKKVENYCSTQKINAANISRDYEETGDWLEKEVKDGTSPISIVVRGNKRAGKSSLLRYLVNRALNVIPTVYYLDMDPGQSEFTPPGVLSLVKVTDPLLGPPYSHLQKPIKMIFTGSITPQTSPQMYNKSMEKLITTFKTQFPNEVLFVNTMGWMKDIGGICFEKAMQSLNPSLLIELVSNEEHSTMVEDKYNETTRLLKIPSPAFVAQSKFSAQHMRNFALLAYFGNCQKYYKETTLLHEFRPFQVHWDDLAIYAGDGVPANRLIEAVLCGVVALCHVDETLMIKSDYPEYHRTLYKDPHNLCIGFGIVRAVDETKKLLYITTPLNENELKAVNTIIKGNIMLPHVAFLKQDILNTKLPFTDDSLEPPTAIRQTVRRRAHKSPGQKNKN